MTGGEAGPPPPPPAPLTENVSVRHCVLRLCRALAVVDRAPFLVLTAETVAVCGPVITNVTKSSRSYL
jgi:hypothetical protein